MQDIEATDGEDGGVEAAKECLDVVEVHGDEKGEASPAAEEVAVEDSLGGNEGEDGGVEAAKECLDVVEVHGDEKGEASPAAEEVAVEDSLGGSRWRRNGCRFVLLFAFRNGSNVFVMFCNMLRKKKIKQENKHMQRRVRTNEKVVHNADKVVTLPH